MATCKDCIHYEVCTEYRSAFWGHKAQHSSPIINASADSCIFYKDHSRFVELPCKVGDTVYCGSFGKLMEDEIICITIDANETRVVLKRGISYDIDKINQMFFLTREEAE